MISELNPNQIETLQLELDPTAELFLIDHAMNGIPILPGVVGLFGFEKIARRFTNQNIAPDRFFRMENINFLVPVKFYRDEKKTIAWTGQFRETDDPAVVSVVLESDLLFRNRPPERVVHFTGTVRLTDSGITKPAPVEPDDFSSAEFVSAEAIYRLFFHGPTFQVLNNVRRSGETVIGSASENLSPLTLSDNRPSIIPMLIELCFQTVSAYEAGTSGIVGLPRSIGSLTVYDPNPSDWRNCCAIVKRRNPNDPNCGFDACVTDASGNVILEIHEFRTAPLPFPVADELLERLRPLSDTNRDH